MESKPLKKGYTTGVHASFAFKSALEAFLKEGESSESRSVKMDNDDLDVTKGCEIVVTFGKTKEELRLNTNSHNPQIINSIELYAGEGVGVVTKKGLKIDPEFPAINPIPLKALEDIARSFVIDEKICCAVSVTGGEEIAKETANAKVGVIGGISILGTTGFVKPVSNEAYLDSVRTEIEFAHKNGYETIALTIGNSSLKKAKESYSAEQIVEIGNFIDDSYKILREQGFKKIVLFAGIGKMTKVAQGFKNTHNRFGDMDFKLLEEWTGKDLKDYNTAKEIRENIEGFDKLIVKKAEEALSLKTECRVV